MGVQVKALRTGYYDNKRFREGALFEMDESALHYNDKGELLSPQWVEIIQAPAPKAAKGRKRVEAEVSAEQEADVL